MTANPTLDPDEMARFLRDHWTNGGAALIEFYLGLQHRLTGIATPPMADQLAGFSDQARNALDHVARACTATDPNAEMRMARWHLHLAEIDLLLRICAGLDDLLTDVFGRSASPIPLDLLVLTHRVRTQHAHLLHAVLALMAKLDALKLEARGPNIDEMEATQLLVTPLRITVGRYAEPLLEFRRPPDGPWSPAGSPPAPLPQNPTNPPAKQPKGE